VLCHGTPIDAVRGHAVYTTYTHRKTVRLTWKQPLDHFLEVVVITQSVIECPDVASIKHNSRITARAVWMMTLVKAHLMPADFNEWTVTVWLDPVWCDICYKMQQGCNDAQYTGGKCQPTIGAHWRQRHWLDFRSTPRELISLCFNDVNATMSCPCSFT